MFLDLPQPFGIFTELAFWTYLITALLINGYRFYLYYNHPKTMSFEPQYDPDTHAEDLANRRREQDIIRDRLAGIPVHITNPRHPDSTYLGDDLYIMDVGDGWFEFHNEEGTPLLTLKDDVARCLLRYLKQNIK